MRTTCRIIYALLALCVATLTAAYGEPLVRHNADAIMILTTVYTVFAGFLVAIITLLGDPTLLPEGSWRTAETRQTSIEAKLITHTSLFLTYLVALALLFVSVIIRDAPEYQVSEAVKLWVGRIHLFFGALSFTFTFALAKSMLAFQLARIDAEIEKRRSRDGIPSDSE